MPEISEGFRSYVPPAWVRPTTERLLKAIPVSRLSGLKTVVLTASNDLNHDRRRQKTLSRKKKVRIVSCRGLYHQKWHGEPAWIELFVDNIVAEYEGWNWLPLVRDLAVGEVLAHEIGHHVHATASPEHREREDVADEWASRLLVPYFLRRYWYFMPAVFGLYWVVMKIESLLRKVVLRLSASAR
ncbi:MAG: ImmA/IrrE family metallo-endopeptidase [Planctomycetaceae bacterium]|nr:ImmA/IrrE family metallo-endopeptidase [Planctomycetaceae bacterium]